jgi:hypothetical protein
MTRPTIKAMRGREVHVRAVLQGFRGTPGVLVERLAGLVGVVPRRSPHQQRALEHVAPVRALAHPVFALWARPSSPFSPKSYLHLTRMCASHPLGVRGPNSHLTPPAFGALPGQRMGVAGTQVSCIPDLNRMSSLST